MKWLVRLMRLSAYDMAYLHMIWLMWLSALADKVRMTIWDCLELIICLVWEQNVILHTGSLAHICLAAASLVSLGRENDQVIEKILLEGPMKVQAVVAEAVSELVSKL